MRTLNCGMSENGQCGSSDLYCKSGILFLTYLVTMALRPTKKRKADGFRALLISSMLR